MARSWKLMEKLWWSHSLHFTVFLKVTSLTFTPAWRQTRPNNYSTTLLISLKTSTIRIIFKLANSKPSWKQVQSSMAQSQLNTKKLQSKCPRKSQSPSTTRLKSNRRPPKLKISNRIKQNKQFSKDNQILKFQRRREKMQSNEVFSSLNLIITCVIFENAFSYFLSHFQNILQQIVNMSEGNFLKTLLYSFVPFNLATICKTPFQLNLFSRNWQKSPISNQLNFSEVEKSNTNLKLIKPSVELKEVVEVEEKQTKQTNLYHKRGRYRGMRNKRAKARVKYFDPNNAPLITEPFQFLIESEEVIESEPSQNEPKKSLKQKRKEKEMQKRDTSPFIILKHRREPKKYKKYLNNQEQSEQNDSFHLSQSGQQ